jgi:hypothetical protein
MMKKREQKKIPRWEMMRTKGMAMKKKQKKRRSSLKNHAEMLEL